MGSIKNRERRSFVFAVLLLVLGIFITACSADGGGEKADAPKTASVQKTTEKKDEKKAEKEKEGEIPDDLFPGQGEEIPDAEPSEDLEIVGEDGTVYAQSSDRGGGNSQSVAGSTSSGSGGGSGASSSQKDAIEIQFSVDSANADGSVSYSAAMTLQNGATVYQALQASGLRHTGSSYVQEIGGLWEKDFGGQSGWKYYVNGSAPMMSCTDYILKDGDNVQWVYVLSP